MCEFFIYGECSVMASTKHLRCFRGVRISHSPQITKIYAHVSEWFRSRSAKPKTQVQILSCAQNKIGSWCQW